MSGWILKAASEFTVVFLGTSRSDDSTGDRLNYRYTAAILVVFTIIVSNREFTMKRIQCWVPAFFTGNYVDYTNNVCWVRNTYYIDDESHIPESTELRRQSSIRYYQWIPFILVFEAFFFFVPYAIWRVLCQRSGIDIRDMVEAATDLKRTTDDEKREELMKYMLSIMDQYVDDPRRQSNNRETVWWKKCFIMFFPSSGRYMGDYLRNLFIFVKILYVINVFGQLFLLSFLLGQPFWSLGFTVLKFIYEGKGWDYQSRYFPKVTLCDFQIREANSLSIAHTYTVMCVLPVNLFNQQIFTFLWFWFVIVILLTIYDLFIWVYRLFFRREAHLLERLKVMNKDLVQKWPFNNLCSDHINESENERLMRVQTRDESSSTGDQVYTLSSGEQLHHQSRMYIVPRDYYKKDRTLFDFFNLEYLEADGHFIIRIIGTNGSDFVATRIVHRLYEICCERRFRANEVKPIKPELQKVLYKYLILPEKHSSRPPKDQSAPRPLPRSSSKDDQQRQTTGNKSRSRSDTLPFVPDINEQKQLTKRSQSHSKHVTIDEDEDK